jgi:uncharacterized peroxidase-related enzyme
MLDYSSKLTKTPESMTQEDIKLLKEEGFSDRDILDITMIASYFNYTNRITSALGIELDYPPQPQVKIKE